MDRVIERIIELLTAGLSGRGIVSYYNGYPTSSLAMANLPAIAVRGTGMTSEILDTHRNQETYTIQIVAINSTKNTVNTTTDQDTPEREIRKLFEERDSGNELKSDTIQYVIERQFMYDETYNINCRVDSAEFGTGIDPVYGTQSDITFGIMTVVVTAIPHRIKS